MNTISILLDGDGRLESKDEISDHMLACYKDLLLGHFCLHEGRIGVK